MGDHGEDDLPPISEEDPPLVELHAPECDQKMSQEVRDDAILSPKGLNYHVRWNFMWSLTNEPPEGTGLFLWVQTAST